MDQLERATNSNRCPFSISTCHVRPFQLTISEHDTGPSDPGQLGRAVQASVATMAQQGLLHKEALLLVLNSWH